MRSARLSLLLVVAIGCGPSMPPASDAGSDAGVDPCTAMVMVPAGPFFRGCNSALDMACSADESPSAMITLSAFSIGTTEVTNACYQRCVDAGRCTPANGAGITLPAYPVVGVDDTQAAAYCTFLGGRLPTEAEWEKAARGTDMRVYPWGNASPTCDLANSYGCTGSPDPVGSHPTGASPYGALDMAGNVEEWVSDWYDASYYATSPTTDPQGPATGMHRVRRGGTFRYVVPFLRCSNRGDMDPPGATPNLGFRCVRPMH
jgi:formylglycine-generating enzyme required for sulfatase activity